MSVLVEACVGSVDDSLTAALGGAHRLELCDNLDVGGTTPSRALIDEVKARLGIPVSVMIRPRGGSFVHTPAELDAMRRDIEMALRAGADMLVFGVLDDDGRVHERVTRELVARAAGTPVTFHKAFDTIADLAVALDALIDAGVSRVLTSGGAPAAIDGAGVLATLVERADGRITIMAGGKVRAPNARELVRRSGVSEIHARCELDPARIRDLVSATR